MNFYRKTRYPSITNAMQRHRILQNCQHQLCLQREIPREASLIRALFKLFDQCARPDMRLGLLDTNLLTQRNYVVLVFSSLHIFRYFTYKFNSHKSTWPHKMTREPLHSQLTASAILAGHLRLRCRIISYSFAIAPPPPPLFLLWIVQIYFLAIKIPRIHYIFLKKISMNY